MRGDRGSPHKGARIEDHHAVIERSRCDDRGSRCGDRGSWCGDRGSRCGDRGSRCGDRGSPRGARGSRCGARGSRCGERGIGMILSDRNFVHKGVPYLGSHHSSSTNRKSISAYSHMLIVLALIVEAVALVVQVALVALVAQVY